MKFSIKSANILKLLYSIKFVFNVQETSLVGLVVRKLLLNYITRPRFPSNQYNIFSEGSQPGVLQRVGSAAGRVLFNAIQVQFCRHFLSVACVRPQSSLSLSGKHMHVCK